jgi:hypothetical protein
LDDALAANIDFERSGGTLDVRTELLQRYASPAIVAQVQPKVDGMIGRLACRPQAALLAYFLRADPPLGRTLLDRALASRDQTGCFRTVLKDVGKLRMTPELEAAAIDHLDDSDTQVVISAIETLGHKGSTAAAQPLRAHFEHWHRSWDGRQEELRYTHAQNHPDSMQGMVEITFLQSLGRAQAWLTGEEELRDLRSLCVTDNCRSQADSIISDAGSRRLSLLRIDNPDDDWIRLAQYELTSLAAARQKLSQFPRGTSFTLDATSIDPDVADRVVSELTKTAAPLEITIRRDIP